jgi:hypothetical protein
VTKPPPRLERLGAVCVNLAPLLAPGCIYAGVWLGGASGMEALGLVFVLGIWSAVGCSLVLATNAWLLVRRRCTLGLAYFRLAVDAPSGSRLLLAEGAVLVVPPAVACVPTWLAFKLSDNDQELQLAVFVAVVLSMHVANFLAWLRPDARTLGDRLGGAKVLRLGLSPTQQLWPDVALVAPPLLVTAAYGALPGVLVGGLVATLLMLLPAALHRLTK